MSRRTQGWTNPNVEPAPEGFTWAWGDNGYELAPIEECVFIPVCPDAPTTACGQGTLSTPATEAFFHTGERESEMRPAKLIAIEPVGTVASGLHGTYARQYPMVRYLTKGGRTWGCSITSAADALHPWFGNMSAEERGAIWAAWQTAGVPDYGGRQHRSRTDPHHG